MNEYTEVDEWSDYDPDHWFDDARIERAVAELREELGYRDE